MPEGANDGGNAANQQIVQAAGAVATAVIDTLRDTEGRVHAETAVAATAAAAGARLLRDALGDALAKLEPGSVALTDDVNDRGQALLGLVMTAAAQAGVAWDVSGDAPPPENAPHGEIVDLVSQVEPAIVRVLTELGVEASQWPTCCIMAALDLIIQTSEVLDTSVATQVLTEALVAGSKTVPRPLG